MAIKASIKITQHSKDSFFISDETNYDSLEPKISFTSRKIAIYNSKGDIFRQPNQVADEIDWDVSDNSPLEIEGIDKDYAFRVIMILTPSVPVEGSIYDAKSEFALRGYGEDMMFNRFKKMAVNSRNEENPMFIKDTMYMRLNIDAAVEAAKRGDLHDAQKCLTRVALRDRLSRNL